MYPIKGVDISTHNWKDSPVDFAALKAAGVKFVIIRTGYGDDYPDQHDVRMEQGIRGCEEAGLPWGVYHYSYATDRAGGLREANHCLRLLNGRKPVYGVWFDMEDNVTLGGDLAGAADAFCQAVQAAGLYAGVYANYYWFKDYLTDPVFDKYDRWVAQYNYKCDLKKPYGIWQFTDKLVIGGKKFDADYAYKDYPALTGKKEEVDMTVEEVKKLVEETTAKAVKTALDKLGLPKEEKVYNTLEELPNWARDDIREMMDKGIIKGTGNGKLGMTQSEIKSAIISWRMRGVS